MRQQAGTPPVKNLTSQEIVAGLAVQLKAISLITGLKIEDSILKDFTKSVMRFLLTYYGRLSLGEISLAFELNAANELPTKVAIYGSNLTIEFIGSVLSTYSQKRVNLATKIAQARQPELIEEPLTEEQMEIDEKQFANEYYRKWLNNEFSAVSLEYAHQVYDVLDHRGIIQLPKEEKDKYFSQSQEIRQKELSAPAINRDEKKDHKKLIDAYLKNQVPVPEKKLLQHYAKRLVLLDYFKTLKEDKKTKIFII